MNTIQQTLTAGQVWSFGVGGGGHFRVISLVTPIDVTLTKDGAPIVKALQVMDGFWSSPKQEFNGVIIESNAAQTIKVGVSDGLSGYDRYNGSVTVLGQSGAFAQAVGTVTNTAANLLAANVGRRYLLIQNKNASGSVYVNFGGVATVANGILILPGGAIEFSGAYLPVGAVSAIGDIASNANVVTVEG